MSVSCKLPPSWRDFEVFRAVIVGGKSTREAAELFRLSQTRICQIVERTKAWQAEVLPAECPLPEEGRLRLSQNIAVERIDSLYCEVMGAWRKSQGEVKQTRTSRYGDEVTTVKTSCGDSKYLLAAMRLVTASAEIGRHGGLALPDDEVGWAVPTAAQEGVVGTAHPTPKEDCSPNGRSQPIPPPSPDAADDATATDDNTSRELSPPQRLARRVLMAPVQHDHAAALASSKGGTRLDISPSQPGVISRPLTRQQRRKLQRALRVR
ncbi:MAG TPA: hypothetical protein VFB80_23185 [Pirellulaceae bacterium]|nr:hypothetical protein [Pirellulaceae bacterium]